MSKFPFIITSLLILTDSYFFVESSDLRIFGILFIYIIFLKIFKLKSKTTFLISLFLFVIVFIQFVFSNPSSYIDGSVAPPAERIAVWVFMLMLIGIFQKFKE